MFLIFQGNPLYLDDATESFLKLLNIMSKVDTKLGKSHMYIRIFNYCHYMS